MRRPLSAFFPLIGFVIGFVLAAPALSFAHGFIGKRFFPESLTVMDPFPSDEADLLAFSHRKDNNATVNTYGAGISKKLTPDLSIGVDGTYDDIRPNDGAPMMRGFENVGLDLKYAILRVPAHEFLLTTALGWEIGGSGSRVINREPHSAVTPQLTFGYGLGDLPEGLKYLKPFAITGQVGLASSLGNKSPDAAETADILRYGLVVEYSLLYLQSFIKDVGVPWPLDRLVPVVEFNFQKVINGPNAYQTTGTANPGFIWSGHDYELGLEAVIPMNDRTGRRVGVQGLIHLFLDDMFPHSYGRPLFKG